MGQNSWDSIGSPRELADRLWSAEALRLSPGQFRKLAGRVWDETRSPRALWKLGGSMNDYLRRRPGTITVPTELPWLLLSSRQCDPRIVGLKLLKHTPVGENALLQEILKALERRRNYERSGGICQLHYFIDRFARRRVRKRTSTRSKIVHRLTELAVRSRDGDEREYAGRVLQHFKELLP